MNRRNEMITDSVNVIMKLDIKGLKESMQTAKQSMDIVHYEIAERYAKDLLIDKFVLGTRNHYAE